MTVWFDLMVWYLVVVLGMNIVSLRKGDRQGLYLRPILHCYQIHFS